MSLKQIKYLTDTPVELLGPYDSATLIPISDADTSAVCSYSVYDTIKSAGTVALAVASGTAIVASNASLYVVGDTLAIRLDDKTLHDGGLITAIDLDTGIVDITNAIPSNASVGSELLVALGAAVNMPEFGTPVVGRIDWGFRALLADTYLGLKLWMFIDIVISLIGTPGGGMDRRDVIHAQMVENIDS